jgi:acetolactate synthase small subunit
LRYGDFYKLISNENIYAYVRSDFNERILVILNKSDKKESVNIILPEIYKAKKLTDLIDGSEIDVNSNSINIVLSGKSFKIVKL